MKKQSASGKEDLIPTKKLKDDASNKNDGMAKLKKTIHRMSRKVSPIANLATPRTCSL